MTCPVHGEGCEPYAAEKSEQARATQFASCVSILTRLVMIVVAFVFAAIATVALADIATQARRANDIECIKLRETADSVSQVDVRACS